MHSGRPTWRFPRALLLLVLCVEGCGSSAPEPVVHGGHRILFIGNSLTYTNQLPLIVQALADSAGASLQVESVTRGGASLEDLWTEGTALRAIERGSWTVVVMQQGPSALPESRVDLRTWTARFAERIAQVGARPALYMVWPAADRAVDFDRVSESYALAAGDVDGMLFPAGEVWRATWRRDPAAPLYGPDGFHPTVAGSYAAALAIYGVLYGPSAQPLPTRLRLRDGTMITLAAPVAATIQEAAAEANERFGRR